MVQEQKKEVKKENKKGKQKEAKKMRSSKCERLIVSLLVTTISLTEK